MLVVDVISAIESNNTSIKELSKQHNVSDRTIQSKIKKLGFKWIPTERRYEFVGDDLEKTNAVKWESLFLPVNTRTQNKPIKAQIEENQNDSNSESTSILKVKENQKTIARKVVVNQKHDEIDSIDRILAGKEGAGRKYRGFYFDSDVLSIIDSVSGGKKSELVNECLRRVFKEKGLL